MKVLHAPDGHIHRIRQCLRVVMMVLAVLLSTTSAASDGDQTASLTVVHHDAAGRYDLSGKLRYLLNASLHAEPYVDESTFEHLRDADGWEVHRGQDALSLGYKTRPVWLELQLLNTSSASAAYVLELAWPILARVDFYLLQDSQLMRHQRSGFSVAESVQPRRHRMEVFPFELEAGARASIFMRVESDGVLLLPVRLQTQQAFEEYDSALTLILGIFFGAMGVMALYNLSLALLTGDSSYYAYVAYVLALMLFQANVSGLAGLYLWPDSIWLKDISYSLTSGLGFATAAVFTILFLELRRNSPWMYRFAIAILVYWLLTLIACTFVPKHILGSIGFPMALLSCVAALGAAIYLAWQGQRSARYFVVAWSMLIIGATLYVASMSGLIPRNPLTEYAQAIGSLLEVVLLSFALAERINRTNAESARAQQRALDMASQLAGERADRIAVQEQSLRMQQQATEALETKVRERTLALSEMNVQLEKASQTDALTGVSNRRHFDDEFERLLSLCSRGGQMLSLIFIDADHFKKINDEYGHQVGDECLRQLANTIRQSLSRSGDLVARFGGEEFVVAMPMTSIETALGLAEALRIRVAELDIPVDTTIDGRASAVCSMRVSIGLAGWVPESSELPQKLIKAADDMLYRAKERGRNRCEALFQNAGPLV